MYGRNFLSSLTVLGFLLVSFFINAENAHAQFTHPGLLHTAAQLDNFKAAANNSALTDMAQYYSILTSDPRAQAYVSASPSAIVVCDTASADALLNDAMIVYLNALRWVQTGNTAYSNTAINAVNAWVNTFQDIQASGTTSAYQHNLVSSWAIPMWVNGVEIIRRYNGGAPGWSSTTNTKFNAMMDKLYSHAKQTLTQSTSGGGTKYESNWAASAALSAMSIGIYQSDAAKYDFGLSHIKRLMPVLILSGGKLQEMETRDCGHPQYTLRAFVQAAQMAANQGDYSLLLMTNSTAAGTHPILLRGLNYLSDSKLIGYPTTVRSCPSAKLEGGGFLSLKSYNLIGRTAPKMQAFVNQVIAESGGEGQDVHFVGWSTATAYANTYPANNGFCSNGILSADGFSCCANSCGTCGGSGCSGKPGGAASCCTSQIQSANLSCSNHAAPCAITAPF